LKEKGVGNYQTLEATESTYLAGARRGDHRHFEQLVEPYRAELQLHCYRMLGSLLDAEDLLQETLLRAWKYLASYEGAASFRAWLYKIATNACLDALDKRARRILPTVSHPAADPNQPFVPPGPEATWLEPIPDALLPHAALNPEAEYSTRESVRLAFMVALQMLPARQRAVLILRDVIGWRAREVADLLDTTVPAVNSALHRARTAVSRPYQAGQLAEMSVSPNDEATRTLLDQYVRAWEAADVKGLIALLKEDATITMPPSPSWYAGRAAIGAFLAAAILVGGDSSVWRLKRAAANAQPAFGIYRHDPAGHCYQAFAIQVLTLDRGQVSEITNFLQPDLFDRFALPPHL
jgi:RNA polymerase sigma-70 factor, ECF subfamily